ncbi:MAG: cyclodeaminase/cyclohydrolase family protein [Phycisphaerae bacterium]|nr:cyclodeaminase/cyclohydrolase family protein [Phycisphaerae bacterium]
MNTANDSSLSISLGEFLDSVAARTPAPGGGAVAAACGALACALARMVVAYSVRKDTETSARGQLDELADRLLGADQILRTLIDRDGQAYENLTRVRKARQDSARSELQFQRAVMDAISVPMEIAAVAERSLVALEALRPLASRMIVSDLGVAATLAEAAVRAARFSVAINLQDLADRDQAARITEEIDRICAHAASHHDSLLQAVRRELDPSSGPGR